MIKNFTELLNDLVGRFGLGTLADQIKADPAALSRFRSDQGALCLNKIDSLMEIADVVMIARIDLQKMEDALETLSDLWKAERKKNGNGTRKEK